MVGVVAIDIQAAFVASSSTPDMDGLMDRTRATLAAAASGGHPFFLTFEGSMEGEQALHGSLRGALPPQTRTFVKTTYAATGLPAFRDAVAAAGLTHAVVLGAETDVCVLQTVLGLRRMGLEVVLQNDAVFTEETNPSPALRRLSQAGVTLASAADVVGYLARPDSLPRSEPRVIAGLPPLQTAVVLHRLTDAALRAAADPYEAAETARLRELLLVAEWFQLPVYSTEASLPAALSQGLNLSPRPLAELGGAAGITHVIVAGTEGDLAAGSFAPEGRTLFLMEDALLGPGGPGAQRERLGPLVEQGAVPTTYKTFYYEMTRSVSLEEWPSPAWIERDAVYYERTRAPEDLPPIGG